MKRAENKPLLSICIPTYNRAPFLDEAIESVISQITDDIKDLVELCISDNASEDNTEDIINKWKAISPIPIVYHRNERNMGFDYNALKVVEIANGEYCWYLGSDDKIVDGAIKLVLNHLLEFDDTDILIARSRIETDLEMKKILRRVDFFKEKLTYVDSSNRQDLLIFLKSVKNQAGIFGYLSVLVFRKSLWKIDDNTNDFLGTAFAYTYQLFKILLNGCRLYIIDEPIVFCRTGNDSFASEGIVKRSYIDYDGYIKIADKLLSEDKDMYNEVIRVMKKHHSYRH
ncbi:MAG: glycosyltransferase family 2 protein, partial [Thermodesulfovibrio sp.]|nr:glycosyltransferase family 2 protein [Thermodesulfovibrio sp.]